MNKKLSHLDSSGAARMVDVGGKSASRREATAGGQVAMSAAAFAALQSGAAAKGNVLATAQLAAIMAAKKTAELIPLCHPLPLESVTVEFDLDAKRRVVACYATATTSGKTGVEMEALTAASVGLLTIYDMLKAADRAMVISDIKLLKKSGGKSGDYTARPRKKL